MQISASLITTILLVGLVAGSLLSLPNRLTPANNNVPSHHSLARTSYSGPPSWTFVPYLDPATNTASCAITPDSHCCCGAPCGTYWEACPWDCAAGHVSASSTGSSTPANTSCKDYDNMIPPEKEKYVGNATIVSGDSSCEIRGFSWLHIERPRTHGGARNSLCCAVGAPCDWEGIKERAEALNYTFTYNNASGNQQIVTAFTNVTSELSWAYFSTSTVCSMIMGCPATNSQAYGNGSYIDILSSMWTCLILPSSAGSASKKAILIKTTGANQTACLSSDEKECLEFGPLCCNMWSSLSNLPPVNARLVTCSAAQPTTTSAGVADGNWCNLATESLATASQYAGDPEPYLSHSGSGGPNTLDGVVGDNCTFARRASQMETNTSLLDLSAGPWLLGISLQSNYYTSIYRRTGDGRVACLPANIGLPRPIDCLGMHLIKACEISLVQSTPSEAKHLVQSTVSMSNPIALDAPAALVGATLGPWSCVRQCNDTTTFYSHVRRYGRGGIVPLVSSAKNEETGARFLDSACQRNQSTYKLPNRGYCVDPKDCPDWMASLEGGLPSFNCTQETCSTGPWTCVQSQDDKANYVFVRLTCDSKVQCLGPDGDRCSWYTSNMCDKLAKGEPEPNSSNEIGMVCSQTEEGWCRTANDVLTRDGELPVPKCCPAASLSFF